MNIAIQPGEYFIVGMISSTPKGRRITPFVNKEIIRAAIYSDDKWPLPPVPVIPAGTPIHRIEWNESVERYLIQESRILSYDLEAPFVIPSYRDLPLTSTANSPFFLYPESRGASFVHYGKQRNGTSS